MNWHQQQAARRAYRTRNLPAHIRSDDWSTSLCGYVNPLVTIDAEHRANPENGCCKKCKRIADARRDNEAIDRHLAAMETGEGNAPELADQQRPGWAIL